MTGIVGVGTARTRQSANEELGDPWTGEWAVALERLLVDGQRPDDASCATESWDPDPMWGSAGGRVYATAFAVMILECVGEGG